MSSAAPRASRLGGLGEAIAGRWGRDRRLRLAAVALGHLVVLLVVFHPVWRGVRFLGWDCLREYWPDIAFQIRSLRAGELPLWNPYSLGGYPFIGDPQAGTLAPMNWLCWLLSLVGGEGAWLIQLKVLGNLLIGLLGFHALVRRRTGSHLAGFAGAWVYVLGSPLLVHKAGAFLWPFLYLPLAVLALEEIVERPRLRAGALLALAVYGVGSAGHPQGFFYGLVILAAYGAYRVAAMGRGALGWLRRAAPALVAALLLGALLLLPVYVPAAAAVADSPRASRGLGYVLEAPLPTASFRELVLPDLDGNWQADVYLGALGLLGAIAGLLAGRRPLGERLLWLGLGGLGLVLALGGATPVLPFFARHVPGFDLFRIAYRHKLIWAFAFAVLASEGFAALAAGELRRRWRLVLGVLAVAWLAVAALGAMRLGLGKGAFHLPAVRAALLWGGLSVAAAAAAVAVPRLRAPLLGAAALLLLVELWTTSERKLEILQPPPRTDRDAAALARMPGVDGEWRYAADGALPYHLPYLHEVRELTGFLNPITLRRLEDVVARARAHPRLLESFNVRYAVGWKRPPPGRPLGGNTVELAGAVPLARVYGRSERVAAARTLDRLSGGPLDVVLVDPADRPPAFSDAGFAPVPARVVRLRRNSVEVEVDSPGPGVLVLAEPYFPGWEASVDGRAAPVFRADYLLRATLVPAGKSRVVFSFRPRGVRLLLAGFVLGLLGAVVVAARRGSTPAPAQAQAPQS